MNLKDELIKIDKQIEEHTNQLATITISLSVLKTKRKKVSKLIDQAKDLINGESDKADRTEG
jgi:septal ring factor EnvC (AmiA/AmiB activator)